jgi:hypothetical protein
MEGKDWKKQLPPGVYYIPLGIPPKSEKEVAEFMEETKRKIRRRITRTSNMSLEEKLDYYAARLDNAINKENFKAAQSHTSRLIKFRVEKILRDFC